MDQTSTTQQLSADVELSGIAKERGSRVVVGAVPSDRRRSSSLDFDLGRNINDLLKTRRRLLQTVKNKKPSGYEEELAAFLLEIKYFSPSAGDTAMPIGSSNAADGRRSPSERSTGGGSADRDRLATSATFHRSLSWTQRPATASTSKVKKDQKRLQTSLRSGSSQQHNRSLFSVASSRETSPKRPPSPKTLAVLELLKEKSDSEGIYSSPNYSALPRPESQSPQRSTGAERAAVISPSSLGNLNSQPRTFCGNSSVETGVPVSAPLSLTRPTGGCRPHSAALPTVQPGHFASRPVSPMVHRQQIALKRKEMILKTRQFWTENSRIPRLNL